MRRTAVMARRIVMGVTAIVLTMSAAAQHVERRGTEPTVRGRIINVTDAGVTVQSDLGAMHFVPWDRVRRVASDTFRTEIEQHADTADQLWRARQRVERHDTQLAEPLFERLFEVYRGRTHETALVVAEGLLRCRLDRGAHAEALIPALEVMRLRRSGRTTASYTMLRPVLASGLELCPALAPAWFNMPGLERVYRELLAFDASGDDVVRSAADLYARSVAEVLGERVPEEVLTRAVPNHPGLTLLSNLLDTSAADATLRENARNRLLEGFAAQPTFAQAWSRYHIGRSLIGETGVGRQQRGLVELAHLPALHADEHPYLAGLALYLTAAGLERTRDSSGAKTVRAVLAARFPTHPIHRATMKVPDFTLPKENG